jgi:hypothetical protein
MKCEDTYQESDCYFAFNPDKKPHDKLLHDLDHDVKIQQSE